MYIKTKFGEFEWDDAKAERNLRKHHVLFTEAMYVFAGPFTNTIDERFDYGETREISTGLIGDILITTVVHTRRGKIRRIISAREANRKERARFTAFISNCHKTS